MVPMRSPVSCSWSPAAARASRRSVGSRSKGAANSYERFLLGTSGSLPALDWNLGAQTLETDNEMPNSVFESDGGALSLRAGPDESFSLRATLRIDDSLLGTPGAVAYGRPDLDAFFDRQDLVTGVAGIFAQRQAQHEVRLGWAQTEQVSVNPEDSGPLSPSRGRHDGVVPGVRLRESGRFQKRHRASESRLQGRVSGSGSATCFRAVAISKGRPVRSATCVMVFSSPSATPPGSTFRIGSFSVSGSS